MDEARLRDARTPLNPKRIRMDLMLAIRENRINLGTKEDKS